MKEKIIKLLQGSREDAIIALHLLVENYNPLKFLKELEDGDKERMTELYGKRRLEPERPFFIWNYPEDREDPFYDSTGAFYYYIKENVYILWCKNAVAYCYRPYNSNLDVIKH